MPSRELHVYYSRLTTDLLLPTNKQAKRAAAQSSLQYVLIAIRRWAGELTTVLSALGRREVITAIRNSNTDADCGTSLEILMRVIHALSQNERLFIESYVCSFRSLVYEAVKTIY